MPHQICPPLIDAELLANHVQDIHHVFFAKLAHFRRIGNGSSTSGGIESSSRPISARRSCGRICSVCRTAVPARRTYEDTVPAPRVIAHRSDENVTALFR